MDKEFDFSTAKRPTDVPALQQLRQAHHNSMVQSKSMDKYKQSPDTFKHQPNKLIIQTIQNGDIVGLYGWCISAIFEQDSDIPVIQMRVTGDNYAGNVLITYDAKTHTCDCSFIGREDIKNVPFSNLFDVLDCEIRRGDLTLEEYENKILAHS